MNFTWMELRAHCIAVMQRNLTLYGFVPPRTIRSLRIQGVALPPKAEALGLHAISDLIKS